MVKLRTIKYEAVCVTVERAMYIQIQILQTATFDTVKRSRNVKTTVVAVLSNYDDLRYFTHRNILFGTQSPSKSAKISIDLLINTEKTFKHAPPLRTDWLTLKYAVCHGIGEVARNTNVNPKTTGRKKARMPDWQEEILFQ